MTNTGKENEMKERNVEILKMISHKWLFTIPVMRYPDYTVSEKIKIELEKFVTSIGCKLVECGTGSVTGKILIVAYVVKIEDDDHVEELVGKVKEYLTKNVIPVV